MQAKAIAASAEEEIGCYRELKSVGALITGEAVKGCKFTIIALFLEKSSVMLGLDNKDSNRCQDAMKIVQACLVKE